MPLVNFVVSLFVAGLCLGLVAALTDSFGGR